MAGHGHVTPNPSGARARCGGPAICGECARELAEKAAFQVQKRNTTETWEEMPQWKRELFEAVYGGIHRASEPRREICGELEDGA